MKRHWIAALWAALTLCSQVVLAQEVCPVLSNEEIAEAFGAKDVRLLSGDVAGECNWTIVGSGLFFLQIHKRPDAKEAEQMYEGFEQMVSQRMRRTLSEPRIGQRAVVLMSDDDAEKTEVGLLALDQETLLVIYYYLDDNVEVSAEHLRQAFETVGTKVMGRKAQADQTFGRCELLEPRDIERLLGKGEKTIHRLGPLRCVATVQPGGGSLVVMGSSRIDEGRLASMAEMAGKGCERVMLPEFGAHAHATYGCDDPGDAGLTMHLMREGLYFSIVYAPSGRKIGAADVQALRPVAQRIYQMR